MFKRSILTILSLACAFSCYQQTYAAALVQQQSRYETVKKAVLKYGSIAADVTNVGGGLTIAALISYDVLQGQCSSSDYVIGGPLFLVAGTMASYGAKKLYETYKEYRNGIQQQPAKRSYKAACGNALVIGCGLMATTAGGLIAYNQAQDITPEWAGFALAAVCCGLRTAYLASRAVYKNVIAKPQAVEVKKVK